jgi:hypothetical protein
LQMGIPPLLTPGVNIGGSPSCTVAIATLRPGPHPSEQLMRHCLRPFLRLSLNVVSTLHNPRDYSRHHVLLSVYSYHRVHFHEKVEIVKGRRGDREHKDLWILTLLPFALNMNRFLVRCPLGSSLGCCHLKAGVGCS